MISVSGIVTMVQRIYSIVGFLDPWGYRRPAQRGPILQIPFNRHAVLSVLVGTPLKEPQIMSPEIIDTALSST